MFQEQTPGLCCVHSTRLASVWRVTNASSRMTWVLVGKPRNAACMKTSVTLLVKMVNNCSGHFVTLTFTVPYILAVFRCFDIMSSLVEKRCLRAVALHFCLLQLMAISYHVKGKVLFINGWSYTLLLLFCSLAVLDPRVGHIVDTLFSFISVILIDTSTGSPVHLSMLSIQAMCGLLACMHVFLQATPLFRHGVTIVC